MNRLLLVPAAWWSSDDGRTWGLAASPDQSAATPRAGGLRDVSASGSDLLAVGHREARPGEVGVGPALVWRSTDRGATWTALPDDPSFAGSIIDRVIGIDGGFVAFGSADDSNAFSNPKRIWLAEGLGPAPVPTAMVQPSVPPTRLVLTG